MFLKKNLGLIVAAAVLVALGALAWVLWGAELKSLMTQTMDWVRTAGPMVFFGAMAVLPMAGFPLSPFTLAAGPVFGPDMGAGWVIACALGAVVVNVSLSYWLAARWLRPVVVWLLARLGKSLPEGPVRSGLELTLLLRVVPGTPFFIQSYLLGLARVSFWKIYLPISVAVPAIYISVAVLAGDAIGRGDRRMLVIAGVLLLVVGMGMHFLRKAVRKRVRARAEAAPESA